MDCKKIVFSGHAVRRMFERRIIREDVILVVRQGEIIDEYPEDRPFPSHLTLGFINGQPLHVVIALDRETMTCYVITVYFPDKLVWYEDFRKRRKK